MKELWDIYDEDKNKTGKIGERGIPLNTGEFHLVVMVWLKGLDGRFLISRRCKEKAGGGMWETPGGSALQGEESIDAAMREVKEEIGLCLSQEKMTFLKSVKHGLLSGWFADYWFFIDDFDIDTLVCQKSEVEEVRWATRDEILELMAEGKFFHGEFHKKALFELGVL